MKKINAFAPTAILAICIALPTNAFAVSAEKWYEWHKSFLTNPTNQCAVQPTNEVTSNALSANALSSNLLAQIFSSLLQQGNGGGAAYAISGASTCGGGGTPASDAGTGIRAFY